MHAKSTLSLVSPGFGLGCHDLCESFTNLESQHGLDQSYLPASPRRLFILFVLLSDQVVPLLSKSCHHWFCLFPKFQKLFSFTWSSFHVYGSLLSNQIEASNAYKNWIVWHLRLKSNICMDYQHSCLVIAICVILRRCKKYHCMYESYDVP